jgi:hypothetical protein
MIKQRELTGQRFGSLTVIQRSERKTGTNGNRAWLCQCGCGRFLVVRSDNLITGHSTQCSRCKPRGGTVSVFAWEGVDLNGVV